MVNSYNHVHSFRLSDEDERYYKALMRRFHISSSNQSVAFRKLLRELCYHFYEIDKAEETQSKVLSKAHSTTQSEEEDEEEELSLYEMEADEDRGDEPDYEKHRQEAVHRIIRRGRKKLIYENILAEVRAIKKEQKDQKAQ